MTAACFYVWQSRGRSPYADCHFLIEDVGATGRTVDFKPVLAADHQVQIGPLVGCENGELSFYDWNKDGKIDAVIETDTSFFSLGDYYNYSLHVLEYRRKPESGLPYFELIHSEMAEHVL